ncbi:MAG: response regulator transcription factor [Peptoniphilus sp.]|nr:response regulator transcription factor [Peptoniphilus sp.]MDD7362674.1 response regulator transcription factor [Bacillota bacterium]MDY6044927.1 response regulator transcription factor [Peptoniphilus sp.]
MVRILAVDDEEDILVLIKNILEKRGYDVDICRNPEDIPEERLKLYDLILLDIMMPGVDGLQFCRTIRPKVDCPILFLTAKTMEDDVVEGLLSGADDYVTKPFGVKELSARVEAHLRREKRERHVALNVEDVRFDLSAREVFARGEKVPLTKSEYDICELLARRRGQVFSREQIYDVVFGYDGSGGTSAISEHIKNIRSKFQRCGEHPIETVWGLGYKWK